METYRLTLQPATAFGTPLAGDTLFGQLCWALRHRLGNDRLNELLMGYTQGQPFAVVSDAFPQGFLPLPNLPSAFWQDSAVDRKKLKKRRWLSIKKIGNPLSTWQEMAKSDNEAAKSILCPELKEDDKKSELKLHSEHAQPHNSINRQTGTTGEGQFAPYTQPQTWFAPGLAFDVYVVIDEERLTLDELMAALGDIGQTGYGRDASIGLGKFHLPGETQPDPLAACQSAEAANAWLTLGPCAPQGLGFCKERSHYQPLTRFGRHGDSAVHTGNPFKRPILLARSGAVFWPEKLAPDCRFIGQGIGDVSASHPETVAQGYAPVLGIRLLEKTSEKSA